MGQRKGGTTLSSIKQNNKKVFICADKINCSAEITIFMPLLNAYICQYESASNQKWKCMAKQLPQPQYIR